MNKEYYIKLKAQLDSTSKTNKDLQKQLDSLKKNMDKNLDLKVNVKDSSKEVKNLEKQVASLKGKLEKSLDFKTKLKESNKEIKSLEKQISSLEKKLANLTATKATPSNYFNSLKEALERVGVGSKDFTTNFKQIGNTITSNNEKITKYIDNNNRMLTTVEKLNGKEKIYRTTLEQLDTSFVNNAKKMDILNQKFRTKEEVLESLNVDLKEYYTLSAKRTDTGEWEERYSNNAGKIITLTKKMKNGHEEWNGTLKELNVSVGSNAREADKWKYSWAKAFQSFTTYMSVTTVFYQIKNAIASVIEEVVNLDSALTELKKVTDLEGDSLSDFVEKAYEAGSTVAKTG